MKDVTVIPEEDGKVIICAKCDLPMKNKRITLSYLGSSISAEMPCCENCGQVYFPVSHECCVIEEVEQPLAEGKDRCDII
jgi:hypothetical protein